MGIWLKPSQLESPLGLLLGQSEETTSYFWAQESRAAGCSNCLPMESLPGNEANTKGSTAKRPQKERGSTCVQPGLKNCTSPLDLYLYEPIKKPVGYTYRDLSYVSVTCNHKSTKTPKPGLGTLPAYGAVTANVTSTWVFVPLPWWENKCGQLKIWREQLHNQTHPSSGPSCAIYWIHHLGSCPSMKWAQLDLPQRLILRSTWDSRYKSLSSVTSTYWNSQ